MDALGIIVGHARRLGFSLVGVVRPDRIETYRHFRDWIDAGNAGSMGYLERRAGERADVRRVWEKTRSVVVLTLDYRTGDIRPDPLPPNRGIVSSYALGGDYHDWCGARLDELLTAIRTDLGEHVEGRGYVDTGPILERDIARSAGLGWFGKNTMLIHPEHGSWFFIAELLLSIDLPETPPEARVPDRCGTCTRCLDACPTGAFVGPYLLDSRRCISYLTIEHRGSIPRVLRPLMGAHVFGCDICQDVCPWNERAARTGRGLTDLPIFMPRDDLTAPDLVALLKLTDEEFRRRFAGSPILRAKRRGLARNAAVALGNVGEEDAIPALHDALHDPEPLVREHAGWALMRIAGADATQALTSAIAHESDVITRTDLALSLAETRRRS